MTQIETGTDVLVVGLGNPGADYAHTRHNMGWEIVDVLARRLDGDLGRRRWRSRMGCVSRDGRRVWLLEPQTFMNLSGRAVAEAVRDIGLGIDSIWVVHDELDLPLGRLRIKVGGSAAGHNGVRSIIGSLGGDGFVRFRIGVGKPPRPGSDSGIRHVLGRFNRYERALADTVVSGAADALELALAEGVPRAMNVYNRPGSLGGEEVQ